jgi:hypothetical protein
VEIPAFHSARVYSQSPARKVPAGEKYLRYIIGMAVGVVRGELTHADLDTYPAHLYNKIDTDCG